jgi:hypothetical protein
MQSAQLPMKTCQSLKYLQTKPDTMFAVDSDMPKTIPENILFPGKDVQQKSASQAMNQSWAAIIHIKIIDFLRRLFSS